jgi:isoleucyl-tRNA synthetase
MEMEPLEGYQVEAQSGHAVALSLELDEGLVAEGLAREVVHAVQNARKNAGLEITDRITLDLGGDPELLAAAEAHSGYVAGEVLATSLTFSGGEGEATESQSIEGRELVIGIGRDG